MIVYMSMSVEKMRAWRKFARAPSAASPTGWIRSAKARRRPQLLELAEDRDEAAPVREEDEQEEGREQGDVPRSGRAAEGDRPVLERLVRKLDDVLPAPWDEGRAAGRQEDRDEHDDDDEPRREDGSGDARMVEDDRAGRHGIG